MSSQVCDKALVVGRPHRSLARTIEAAVVSAVDRLLLWRERARTRRLLGTLDDRMLHDIGIDRGAAEREETTPFWR